MRYRGWAGFCGALLVGAAGQAFLLAAPTGSGDVSSSYHTRIEGLTSTFRWPGIGSDGSRLDWSTAAESGVVGFDVVVPSAEGGEIRLNSALIPAANSAAGGHYSWELPASIGGSSLGLDPATLALRLWSEDGGSELHPLYPREVSDGDFGSVSVAASDSGVGSERLVSRGQSRPRAGAPAAAGSVIGFDAFTGASGVYRLSASELAAALDVPLAQVTAGLKNHSLAFATDGRPLAWTRAPGVDGCLLYLPEKRTLYQRGNVFQSASSVSPEPGARDARTSGLGNSLGLLEWNIERDLLAVTTLPGGLEDDFWVWDSFLGTHPVLGVRTYPVALPPMGGSSGPGELTIELASTSEAAHAFQAVLNGRDLGTLRWSGRRWLRWTIPLNSTDLVSGTNQLVLSSTGDRTSLCYLDRLHFRATRALVVEGGSLVFQAAEAGVLSVRADDGRLVAVWDVTVPESPVVLEVTVTQDIAGNRTNHTATFTSEMGHRYVAFRPEAPLTVSRWQSVAGPTLRTPELAVDYLLVCPDALLEPAGRLAAWRESQGLRSRIVSLNQVRHEFSDGVPRPDALRQLLAYARDHWRAAPGYVVLLGDGTYDYRSVLGGADNLVPPPLVMTTFGRAAADSLVLEEPTAATAVGRLSVQTPAELHAIIDRMMFYEQGAKPMLPLVALLLADQPDAGGQFIQDSDRVGEAAVGFFSLHKVYNDGIGSAILRTRMRAELAAGVAWWNYLGHGGRDRMGTEYVTIADVPGLSFGGVSPLVTAMTCGMGQFALPGLNCLAEVLMLKPGVGPMAVWSPSGFSVNYQASQLNRLFAEELTFARDADRLGDVIRRARNRFLRAGGDRITPEFYNLLGDPALKLPFLPAARPPSLIVRPGLSVEDPPELSLLGEPGGEYRIEALDLHRTAGWERVESVRISGVGAVRLSVFSDARVPARLYRAVRE